jgi:hypothetical protein
MGRQDRMSKNAAWAIAVLLADIMGEILALGEKMTGPVRGFTEN